MKKNLYEELGLKQNATKSEIKSSYRSLVKQHHPDAGGEKAGSHLIQGIGAGFVPKVLNTKLIDEIIKIDDDEAFYYGRLLARLEGLLSGISSGAALAATIKIGKRKELMNKRLIVILPSFGERYLSTAMFESNTSIQARKDGYL